MCTCTLMLLNIGINFQSYLKSPDLLIFMQEQRTRSCSYHVLISPVHAFLQSVFWTILINPSLTIKLPLQNLFSFWVYRSCWCWYQFIRINHVGYFCYISCELISIYIELSTFFQPCRRNKHCPLAAKQQLLPLKIGTDVKMFNPVITEWGVQIL